MLLTRQFRLPTYVNGNPTGMMIEACAGLLEDENPEVRIRLELREETGYEVPEIRKVFEAYMSPGLGHRDPALLRCPDTHRRIASTTGGGIDEEDIEVLELPFDRALEMAGTGRDQRCEDHHAAAIRGAEPVVQARDALRER